jgi:hypothetical protein
MRHHHQRPAVHPLTQPGFGRVRRSNSTSIRSTKRPRSARAPPGRCRRATSRSSRPSSISMPGLSPGPVRYRPGCLKAHSKRLRAWATASGQRCSASTRRTAARVRAVTPGIRRTGRCLLGRHRSARTAFGRLRGIALSDQEHAVILPRPAPSAAGPGHLGALRSAAKCMPFCRAPHRAPVHANGTKKTGCSGAHGQDVTLGEAGGPAARVATDPFSQRDAPLLAIWLYAESSEHNELGKELGTFRAWPMRNRVRARRRSGDDTPD